jgi:Protein of unknown function (DUF3237)
MTTLEVEPLFVVRYGDPAAVALGHGPRGPLVETQAVGRFDGPRLRGRIERGSDLWHLRADGVVELDVRALLRTDDGAAIAMRYSGVCTLAPGDAAAIREGRPPQGPFSDRKAIRFETGAPAYTWLNAVQAVGIGEPGAEPDGGWWAYAL